MTKEQIDTLVKSLDRLGLGTDNGDATDRLQSTGNDGLLVSVISVPLLFNPTLNLFQCPGTDKRQASRHRECGLHGKQ